jgi:hypothetical protein
MEKDDSNRKLVPVLLIAVVILLVSMFVFVSNLDLSKNKEITQSEDQAEEMSEDDSSISDYFEEGFSGSVDLEVKNGSSGEGFCELDGQVMREGSVKFGTTCVNKPTEP